MPDGRLFKEVIQGCWKKKYRNLGDNYIVQFLTGTGDSYTTYKKKKEEKEKKKKKTEETCSETYIIL